MVSLSNTHQSDPIPCKCGKPPEINKNLIHREHGSSLKFKFSLSCECGTGVLQKMVRGNNQKEVQRLWREQQLDIPHKTVVLKLQFEPQ